MLWECCDFWWPLQLVNAYLACPSARTFKGNSRPLWRLSSLILIFVVKRFDEHFKWENQRIYKINVQRMALGTSGYVFSTPRIIILGDFRLIVRCVLLASFAPEFWISNIAIHHLPTYAYPFLCYFGILSSKGIQSIYFSRLEYWYTKHILFIFI